MRNDDLLVKLAMRNQVKQLSILSYRGWLEAYPTISAAPLLSNGAALFLGVKCHNWVCSVFSVAPPPACKIYRPLNFENPNAKMPVSR